MKTTDIRDVAVLAAFVSFAYLLVRNYRKKKHTDNEVREFLHFQLF
ncbi:MAG: hypothetical protein LBR48_02255 [Dysgonamonadaceae bacterium]|jgi:hypothetical protein|nr:hypothetical protein [Dysgonamonadaceae bacterium]